VLIKIFCTNALYFIFCSYFCKTFITLKTKIEVAYKITDICVACGTCIDQCPVGAISEGDIYKIDPDTCASCGTCADACPTGAIVEA
jgi:formate hydrogenlyase subunit 6/NADH:ubiquinone oxidoreductase subunit I